MNIPRRKALYSVFSSLQVSDEDPPKPTRSWSGSSSISPPTSPVPLPPSPKLVIRLIWTDSFLDTTGVRELHLRLFLSSSNNFSIAHSVHEISPQPSSILNLYIAKGNDFQLQAAVKHMTRPNIFSSSDDVVEIIRLGDRGGYADCSFNVPNDIGWRGVRKIPSWTVQFSTVSSQSSINLPGEILDQIFGHLPSVRNCLLVCRLWWLSARSFEPEPTPWRGRQILERFELEQRRLDQLGLRISPSRKFRWTHFYYTEKDLFSLIHLPWLFETVQSYMPFVRQVNLECPTNPEDEFILSGLARWELIDFLSLNGWGERGVIEFLRDTRSAPLITGIWIFSLRCDGHDHQYLDIISDQHRNKISPRDLRIEGACDDFILACLKCLSDQESNALVHLNLKDCEPDFLSSLFPLKGPQFFTIIYRKMKEEIIFDENLNFDGFKHLEELWIDGAHDESNIIAGNIFDTLSTCHLSRIHIYYCLINYYSFFQYLKGHKGLKSLPMIDIMLFWGKWSAPQIENARCLAETIGFPKFRLSESLYLEL